MPVERDEVGPKIDYPGLTYAPINEQGVVSLFSMMADEIGFAIEAIRQGFPDALVVDYRANRERGVKKKIEFEFESSHFPKQKSHDATKCDIIVCWEHDWKKIPNDLEVLELKSLLQNLKNKAKEQEAVEELVAPRANPKKIAGDKPDYMTSWDARLQWVLPATRNLALKLIQRLETDLPGVKHQPRFKWHSFFFREPLVRKNEVATLIIGRKTIRLSIRVNPQKFNDPFGIFKPMAGFFYEQEHRAPVTSESVEAVVSVARFAYQGLISVDPTMQAEDLRVVSRVWFDRVVRLQIGNFGARSVQLRDYEVGDWGKKSAGTGRIIEPGKAIVLSVRAEPRKFQKGQSYDVHVWTNTGAMFRFREAL